jgi:hypothetical protein
MDDYLTYRAYSPPTESDQDEDGGNGLHSDGEAGMERQPLRAGGDGVGRKKAVPLSSAQVAAQSAADFRASPDDIDAMQDTSCCGRCRRAGTFTPTQRVIIGVTLIFVLFALSLAYFFALKR